LDAAAAVAYCQASRSFLGGGASKNLGIRLRHLVQVLSFLPSVYRG